MRCMEFSVSITFTKDAKKWPPCIWRQACTRLVIHLVTLSIIPGVSRICRKPCYSILFRSISAFSIDVAYIIDFKCSHKWKSNGFKSGERAGHANRTNPFICKVSIEKLPSHSAKIRRSSIMHKLRTKSNIDWNFLSNISCVNACWKNQRTLCLLVSHQEKKVQWKIYQSFPPIRLN